MLCVCVTPVEALAQQMVPRGGPDQPLMLPQNQDCNVFARMHFKCSNEERFCTNILQGYKMSIQKWEEVSAGGRRGRKEGQSLEIRGMKRRWWSTQ